MEVELQSTSVIAYSYEIQSYYFHLQAYRQDCETFAAVVKMLVR